MTILKLAKQNIKTVSGIKNYCSKVYVYGKKCGKHNDTQCTRPDYLELFGA